MGQDTRKTLWGNTVMPLMYNPMGLYENFRPVIGVIHQGLYTKIFVTHFYAQNAVPGQYEGRNGRLLQKTSK